MHEIADALIRLVAPILVHTADEAHLALHGRTMDDAHCVHTEIFPSPSGYKAAAEWPDVIGLRDRALKSLEDARGQRGIDNPLDAGVEASVPHEVYVKLKPFEPELPDLLGVSRFTLDDNTAETIAINDLRDQPRCDRSWKRDTTVKLRPDGTEKPPTLSDRDARAVGLG